MTDGKNPRLEVPVSSYEIADFYTGSDVRVFLNTGIVMTGKLLERKGNWIRVQSRYKPTPASINLDMVTSIT